MRSIIHAYIDEHKMASKNIKITNKISRGYSDAEKENNNCAYTCLFQLGE